MGFDVTFGGAALAGLLSFVSPCILPIVPPYLCFLAGVSFEEFGATGAPDSTARWRVVMTALVFALGFATVFVALGASASVIGQALAQNFDTLCYVTGGVIVLMGLLFLGILRIPLLYREARLEVAQGPATLPKRLSGRARLRLRLDALRRPCAGGDPGHRRGAGDGRPGRRSCSAPMRAASVCPSSWRASSPGPS